MNTVAQTIAIQTTRDALNALSVKERRVVIKDMMLEMDPASLEDLSNYAGTVSHHKLRGDLDKMLERAL